MTVQLPFEQAHPLDVAPLLRQLQQDGVVHRVRTDPGRFDIIRHGPGHLSFGHGAHYCLGAPLARIELQAVFSQLLARFPAMRLAVPVEQLRMRSHALTGGLTRLPVEW